MNRKHQEKIDILIKFLKRKPKEGRPISIGGLLFDNEDILYKYRALDKHIKLVAECIDEGIITSYYFFSNFERIRVRNYDGKLKLYVLFSNSAKMVLFSSHKHREVGCDFFNKHQEVGCDFFNKFDLTNLYGVKVDINNEEIREIREIRSGGRSFDLVEN